VRAAVALKRKKSKNEVCDKWKQADIYAVCPASLQAATVQAEHGESIAKAWRKHSTHLAVECTYFAVSAAAANPRSSGFYDSNKANTRN